MGASFMKRKTPLTILKQDGLLLLVVSQSFFVDVLIGQSFPRTRGNVYERRRRQQGAGGYFARVGRQTTVHSNIPGFWMRFPMLASKISLR